MKKLKGKSLAFAMGAVATGLRRYRAPVKRKSLTRRGIGTIFALLTSILVG